MLATVHRYPSGRRRGMLTMAHADLETVARRLPRGVRNLAIRALNPLRIRRAKAACAPRWITVFITNHCNARCEHCFYWSELNRGAPELSAEDCRRLFDSIRRPVRTLRLSGGEPFLRRDLEDIVLAADATRKIRKIAIPTHGMMRDLPDRLSALVPRLRHLHVNVSVSFDGLRERHDANRKIRNGFDRAVDNLKQLRELERTSGRFSRSASISLTRPISLRPDGQPPEFVELIDFLKRETGLEAIGCDHVRSAETDVVGLPPDLCSGFTPPPRVEQAPEVLNARHGEVQLSVDDQAEVNRMLAPLLSMRGGRLTKLRLDKQVEVLRARRRLVDCLAGFVDCVIYPSGDVAVCEFTKPFANLRDFDMDLMRVMTSEPAREARRRTRACACTHPCHLSDSLAYDADFLTRFIEA